MKRTKRFQISDFRFQIQSSVFCVLCSVFCLLLLLLCSLAAGTQLSFNSGRLSRLIKYRVDIDKRSMGAEQLDNVIVKSTGMAYKRPGTEYVDDANSTSNVRLFTFEYSTDDAYPLEFGHKYIGFFRTVP